MGDPALHVLVSHSDHSELISPAEKTKPKTLTMKMNCMKSFRKLAAVAAVLATIWLATTSARAAGSTTLDIAEVYGGGGNSGAPYKNDYVVIFNRGARQVVDVNGWSIQYASAGGRLHGP